MGAMGGRDLKDQSYRLEGRLMIEFSFVGAIDACAMRLFGAIFLHLFVC